MIAIDAVMGDKNFANFPGQAIDVKIDFGGWSSDSLIIEFHTRILRTMMSSE